MADWLVLLLKYGGFGAVLLLALFVMGKWLVKRITAALDSYVSAYAQQSASIDARIADLEKLAEEQARLTRIVESIKDEIAAQAKSRDNQWAFRKDVYTNLITTISGMIRVFNGLAADMALLQQLAESHTPNTDPRRIGISDRLLSAANSYRLHCETFSNHVNLAPLAVVEEVIPLVAAVSDQISSFDSSTPETIAASSTSQVAALSKLLRTLQAAGRKDLWGTPEAEARAEGAK
jgi:hypothetical protein